MVFGGQQCVNGSPSHSSTYTYTIAKTRKSVNSYSRVFCR